MWVRAGLTGLVVGLLGGRVSTLPAELRDPLGHVREVERGPFADEASGDSTLAPLPAPRTCEDHRLHARNGDAAARRRFARCALRRGEVVRAASLLANEGGAHALAARILAGAHPPTEAELNRALEAVPDAPALWTALGELYARTERPAEAVDAWLRARGLEAGTETGIGAGTGGR